VAKQPDSPSPLVLVAVIQWVSRITAIGLCFATPPMIGYLLDRWWRWAPVGTFLGVVVGFATGTLQTLRLAQQLPGRAIDRSERSPRGAAEPGSRASGERN
jgi:hypothetical protein